MRRVISLLLVTSVLFTLGSTASGGEDDGTSDDEREFESSLFERINNKRVQAEENELELHSIIRREARIHSLRMLNQQQLSHNRFEERVDRIEENDAGIDGERLCELTASSPIASIETSVRRIFKAWRSASRFRRCLFDREFQTHSAGVGVHYDGDTWWVTFITAFDRNPGD